MPGNACARPVAGAGSASGLAPGADPHNRSGGPLTTCESRRIFANILISQWFAGNWTQWSRIDSEARPEATFAACRRRTRSAANGESVNGGGVMAEDQNNGQVDQPVPENYENLLEDYSHFAPPAADEVLQGTVLGVTAKDVIVDFGYKSEGIVPIEQFQTPDGRSHGPARRRRRRDDRRTASSPRATCCSRTRAPARLRVWDNLEKAYQRAAGGLRPRAGAREGRAGGGRGRQGVHARLAGRSAARAQPRSPDRARTSRSRSSS